MTWEFVEKALDEYRTYRSKKKGYIRYKGVPLKLKETLLTNEVINSGAIIKVETSYTSLRDPDNEVVGMVIWLNKKAP